MRRKGYRGVGCVKRSLSKCVGACRTYDRIQTSFADDLQDNENVDSFRCNVLMETNSETQYTSDFFIEMNDGTKSVRECVWRKHLGRPLTAKLLDLSRNYWLAHGVEDWGIVIEKEDIDENK